MVICAAALYWYGFALYRRATSTWHWAYNIQGFVAYGAHEDAFSPDATRIAIAFGSRCKVLDLTSGKELSTLEGYTGQGLAGFSSDGKIISRFGQDGTDRHVADLWNASDGRLLGSIRTQGDEGGQSLKPVFSPDSKNVVAATQGGLIAWDVSKLKQVAQVRVAWPEDQWLPGRLAWNPTNQELIVVDKDGTLLKIDFLQETADPLVPEQPKAVTSARFSLDGMRLLTINRDDGLVSVWDATTGKVIASISESDTFHASFSPTGNEVVTAKQRKDVVQRARWAPPFWDRSTRLWDATTGKLVEELPTTGVVTFSPDWTFMAEIGPEGLRVARFNNSESCYFPEWFDGHGSSCSFARDNSYLASVNGSGRVAIWRHRDPSTPWLVWIAGHELLGTVLALAALAWAMSGFWRSKTPDAD
jgi:WD40 repeat protein